MPQKHTQVIKYDEKIFYNVMSFCRYVSNLSNNTISVARVRKQFYIWRESNILLSNSVEWKKLVDESKLEIVVK
ncbi:hypothetical protein [Clostridium sp.]|uniref:hypothetical protein n=1 Tax=Clostridium sp. TaxID=1506 RepID=UPI002FC6E6EC